MSSSSYNPGVSVSHSPADRMLADKLTATGSRINMDSIAYPYTELAFSLLDATARKGSPLSLAIYIYFCCLEKLVRGELFLIAKRKIYSSGEGCFPYYFHLHVARPYLIIANCVAVAVNHNREYDSNSSHQNMTHIVTERFDFNCDIKQLSFMCKGIIADLATFCVFSTIIHLHKPWVTLNDVQLIFL